MTMSDKHKQHEPSSPLDDSKTAPESASPDGKQPTPTSPNSTPPKKTKRVWIKRSLIGAVILGSVSMVWMGFSLNQAVSEKFEGQLWQLPSVVYARELTLQPGAPIRFDDLVNELKVLKYRKVASPKQSGEYSVSRQRVELVRRPFEFKEGIEGARHVVVDFDYASIKRISEVESNRELGFLRVEPKMLGMLEAKAEEQRIYLPKDEMPEPLIQALLTTEDRNFYEHDGVSPVAIARAFLANLKAGRTVQGGSTLTQQLAKNLFLSSERSLWRKFKEAYMALIIDYRYDKDQILDGYLNQVYLAQSGADAIHGFALGARFYFGRPLSELRVDQQALLVGLVKGPSYYNPWRYPERAKQRRDLILSLMVDSKQLESADYEAAIKLPLDLQEKGQIANRQPAYFEQIKRELKANVGDDYQPDKGLRLFTSLDPLSQEKAELAVRQTVPKLEKKAGKDLETAVVIADRMSGEIRAMVGGSRPGYAGFNRAIDAKRQIGSIVKPAIYLAALEQPERFSLATSLKDRPLTLKGAKGENWSPRNYDRQYRGEVPLYQALAKSYNVPTVNLGLAVGLDTVIDTLDKLGVDRKEVPKLPSMLLGAFTLTPLQVTQMYQTIASGGHKAELTALSAVTDGKGNIIYQNWPTSSAAVPAQAAWLTMYGMQKVVSTGTGRYLNAQFPSSHLAGKTGTTDKSRDSWYVGIDGREVVTVWMGRDDNKGINLTGSSGALRLYSDYIKQRDPEALVLRRPAQITNFTYSQSQNGTYSASCVGQSKLPAWDPKGNLQPSCVKSVEGFLQKLFSW
jgi:penicillin-binding protein 1B